MEVVRGGVRVLASTARLARAAERRAASDMLGSTAVAWKLWKPLGVESYWKPLLAKLPELARLHEHRGPDLEMVGRLDKDSDGLLLFTVDAELRSALLRTQTAAGEPLASACPKVYRVKTNYKMDNVQLRAMRAGVPIITLQRRSGGENRTQTTLPCIIEREPESPSGKVLLVTLREGRNRQIRKMVGSFEHKVASLRRLTIGGVGLVGLANPGSIAALTVDELATLRAHHPAGDVEMSPFPWRQRLCDEQARYEKEEGNEEERQRRISFLGD